MKLKKIESMGNLLIRQWHLPTVFHEKDESDF